jgi:PAS domain S-box-containing protein
MLEDVPMDAELLEYELRRSGLVFDARVVDTRESFVAALNDFAPDLILSDYSLPRFDGMTALAIARQRLPHTPFLIVTGSVNEETAVRCMQAGATDYLLKGNLARIGPAIAAALERERARSERAEAEAALRRSEANLRAIFNSSPAAVVLISPAGVVHALNRPAREWSARLLGAPLEVGDLLAAALPETARSVWRELLTRALAGETLTGEHHVRDRDGIDRWFEAAHAPVVDDAGQVIGVCLSVASIDARKQAELALRESEARYRDLFDNASDLVFTAAPDGRLLYVNQAWRDTLGYADSEIGTLGVSELQHPESPTDYLKVHERVLSGERVERVEVMVRTKAGAAILLEGNTSCLFQDGRPVAVRGIYRDITERRRVEDQLRRAERLQAAGRLAGGVAHEVNNMMTGVIGFSEFLLRSLSPADHRRREVEEIQKAANRAANVTRQLLAFTRQQFLRPEILDLNLVIAELAGMMRRSLGEDTQVVLKPQPAPARVRADRSQVEQVLINLVLNARDAMSRAGRVLIETADVQLDSVYAGRHPGIAIPTGSYVMLAVSDTGCGMDAETQARIFEPFFTTKPVGQGTGLGLSTVYGIVKQSSGYIWVYSEPGVGSTFKIYLPRAVPSADGWVAHDVVPSAASSGSETVLVAEDEEMVRGLTSRVLREYGYTVLEARDGTEALEIIRARSTPVHLVVSDVVMPDMGGRELGHALSQLEVPVPLLYVSGYTGEDIIQRGLLNPGAPFLQKPFSPAGLASKVRELLDLAYGPRAAAASRATSTAV